MKTIFDIGMYDGSDTEYYLSMGFRVIAVEANRGLALQAGIKFKSEVESGQLTIENKAICQNPGESITLHVCGDDLGSSSTLIGEVESRSSLGSYKVEGVTVNQLVERYGVPYYIKSDIEGADRFCVLALKSDERPKYLSFEAGDDAVELVQHLSSIGYSRFKAINQCNFLSLDNQENFSFRLKRRIIRSLGYKDPMYVMLRGRYFLLRHSSGPAPWASDGGWLDEETLLRAWNHGNGATMTGGWYDIHVL